ncbi:fibronectin type III domain-containing protein [Deefgea salmonis]|uniref:DNRLRE domain-containing protein n=1 Tax=Deefgea salmonis TaxID=2875502 RepID=A0ABS8BKY2_9NEIS|nr:fibronectin type III domain-containing protein [Deefgea salmonis]MCB5196380.1 DNRLRE domain-containing protein [Deefgea salmonis]
MTLSVMKLACLSAVLMAGTSFASVKNVRVVWDANPANEAVVAFSKSGTATSTGQYIKYGTSTTESTWLSSSSAVPRTFKSTLDNYFVRLQNLNPNTDYFFRACDSAGCSEMYFFRTAAADDRSVTVIAGGDSRTDRAVRQQGNRLVQKIRPHFIMFSGDFTDNHSASEVESWLDDWNLTFSPTTVNGIAVKQVHPIIPTVGNHEASDMNFMCSVFGVDADRNGQCSLRDTYFGVNIGTLMRVYTLNTELESSSYANERTAQLAWLKSDMPAFYSSTRWRFGQYHRPMFPRSTSKPAITQIALDWATTFQDYRMNLVNESDTHIAKLTKPVRPMGSNYQESATGTVYIGEGAWGAPVRTADRVSPWIVDQGSFAHFNVIQVSAAAMNIRTVYLNSEASTSTVSKANRDADPLTLPTGWSLWNAATVGDVYSLKLASDNFTELNEVIAPTPTPSATPTVQPSATPTATPTATATPSTTPTSSKTLLAVRDVTISSTGALSNGATVYADGDDAGAQLRALFGWNVAGITGQLKSATVQFNVSNLSKGIYNLYAMSNTWSEASTAYSQASGGNLLGSFTPSATGTASITLNAAGLALIQGWLNGSTPNNGVVMLSGGTSDGVDMTSREGGNPAKLILNFAP